MEKASNRSDVRKEEGRSLTFEESKLQPYACIYFFLRGRRLMYDDVLT